MKLLIVVLLLACAIVPASAQTYHNALVLGTGYAAGPPTWDPWLDFPAMGDPLWMVGPVIQIAAPFDPGALPPVYELTYAFTGFECTGFGMWDDFQHGYGGMFADFENGIFSIYLDTTPDATFANPSTFQDGELVLQAISYVLSLWVGDPSASQHMGMHFMGGSWFDRVSRNGVGYMAVNRGFFSGDIPLPMEILGYIGESTGSYVDVFVPIATQETTWGKIKSLYR